MEATIKIQGEKPDLITTLDMLLSSFGYGVKDKLGKEKQRPKCFSLAVFGFWFMLQVVIYLFPGKDQV